MKQVNKKWLSHLPLEVIANTQDNYLDAYVIALEGWRRGLNLSWHTKKSNKFKNIKTWFVDEPGQLFSLQSKENSHYFFRSRGDKVLNEAVEIGMNKQKTKELLTKAEVPVPKGKEFINNYSENDVINYAESLGYPVVVKPKDGSFGRGVISQIMNNDELKEALHHLRYELKENEILLEKHITGNDYRLYVVGDKVEGAILRIAPNVIGDGTKTIETLIKEKNNLRNLNPRLATCPIRTDNEAITYLNKNNYNLNSIPKENETVYINDKANIYLGGYPVEVLDELSDAIKEIAIQAINAVPGLNHGAVDLMIEKNNEIDEMGYVIELNPTAQLGGILFPLKGSPRDIPSAIIDYYFPETKDNTRNLLAYFKFQEVLHPLVVGAANIAKVTNCHNNHPVVKKLTLKGDFSDIKSIYKMRAFMIKIKLNGVIKVLSENNIELLILGEETSILTFKENFEAIEIQDEKLIHESLTQPIKLGVEIKDTTHNLRTNIKNLEERTNKLKNEQLKLEKEYNKMLNSNSWKLTSPLRKVTGGIKKMIRRGSN